MGIQRPDRPQEPAPVPSQEAPISRVPINMEAVASARTINGITSEAFEALLQTVFGTVGEPFGDDTVISIAADWVSSERDEETLNDEWTIRFILEGSVVASLARSGGDARSIYEEQIAKPNVALDAKTVWRRAFQGGQEALGTDVLSFAIDPDDITYWEMADVYSEGGNPTGRQALRRY